MKPSDLFWSAAWAIMGTAGAAYSLTDGFEIDKASFMYGAGTFVGALFGKWSVRRELR